MFCNNCGKEIPDGSAKCPDCGAEIKKEQQPIKKETAMGFLEKHHPFTLTALVLSALSVLLFIFEIVFMAKNPLFASARTLLLYFGIGGMLLSLLGYRKSEKKALDKLFNLINCRFMFNHRFLLIILIGDDISQVMTIFVNRRI